jgi:hypothetical protein
LKLKRANRADGTPTVDAIVEQRHAVFDGAVSSASAADVERVLDAKLFSERVVLGGPCYGDRVENIAEHYTIGEHVLAAVLVYMFVGK